MARFRGKPPAHRGSQARVPLAASALTLGTLAAALVRRGDARRLASPLLYRLTRRPRAQAHPQLVPTDSRLYGRRRRRLEAHLGRLPDGRRAVVTVPVDGSAHAAVYPVGELRPWEDFERRARLVGSRWGPCRDVSAGL